MKNFFYWVLDLMTFRRGVTRYISGFELRIPTRYFRYFPPNYELRNITFINDHLDKGMVAIDVGAHIGLLSLIMARKVGKSGRVYSFEPTVSTFNILKRSIRINHMDKVVHPYSKAVSDSNEDLIFFQSKTDADNANSLVNSKREVGVSEKRVQATTIDHILDDINFNQIDFIKIDAEGAELDVLKGAKETIKKFIPKVILALHPDSIVSNGDSLDDIWEYVIQAGYDVHYKNQIIERETFTSQNGLFDVFLLPHV